MTCEDGRRQPLIVLRKMRSLWWLGALAVICALAVEAGLLWRQSPRAVWSLERHIGYPLQVPSSVPAGLSMTGAQPVAGSGAGGEKVAMVAYRGGGRALYLLESPLPLALPGGAAAGGGLLYHGTARLKQALVHRGGEYILVDGLGLSRSEVLSVATHLKRADGGIAFAFFRRLHAAH